jgi:hypothetical protein
VQVDPATLELELVDLPLAVVVAAGLEREQFASRGSCCSSVSSDDSGGGGSVMTGLLGRVVMIAR